MQVKMQKKYDFDLPINQVNQEIIKKTMDAQDS
jgi:hypothetical protein